MTAVLVIWSVANAVFAVLNAKTAARNKVIAKANAALSSAIAEGARLNVELNKRIRTNSAGVI